MSRKLTVLLVPLFLLGLLLPATQASAAPVGKSDVSIEIWPKKGVFGYVESANRKCEANRVVQLFRKSGTKLVRIGRDKTSRTTNGYIWIVENRRATSGALVARTTPKGGCQRSSTRRVIPRRSGDFPTCPSKDVEICVIRQMKVVDIAAITQIGCKSWGARSSQCFVKVTEGPVPYCCWTGGALAWGDVRDEGRRHFEFEAFDYNSQGKPGTPGPTFSGWLPDASSARFNVTSATLPPWKAIPGAEWYTPEIPDAKPGTPGGPIYFNWDAGALETFSLYMGGYLFRRE